MITGESFLRDAARLIVWYPLRYFILFLPLPLVFAIYRLMGTIHYVLSSKKRTLLRENMAVLARGWQFPENRVVQRYFQNHYINQLLIFLFPQFNRDSIGKCHSFRGIENLEKELSRGKGCILIHGHFGPVHLPLFALGANGYYRVAQIGLLRRPKGGLSFIGEQVSFKLRWKYENMIPAQILQADSFLRTAFEHLKGNGILFMTGDGAGGSEFVGKFSPFPFLGQKMLFPTGPAALAAKTGASIIPMFTIREKGNKRYVTVIEEPIRLELTGRGEDDRITNTAKFVRLLESYVKEYPDHWHFWDEFSKGKLLI